MTRERVAILVVATLGALVSAYLVWVHYSGSLALCIGVGGCEAVQTSRFAMVGPIPVALIGLAGFVALLVAAIAYARGVANSLVALFGLSLAASAYVGYLTYLELFVLGAICPWCVSVALCAVLIFGLTVRELLIDA